MEERTKEAPRTSKLLITSNFERDTEASDEYTVCGAIALRFLARKVG